METGSQKAIKIKDAEIAVGVMQGKSSHKIAQEVGLHRNTVYRHMQSEDVRGLMINALVEKNFTIKDLAQKNIDMLSAKKTVVVGNKTKIIDDNPARGLALKEMNSIHGVHAPKQVDLRDKTAQASLEDLAQMLEEADAGLEVGPEPAESEGGPGTDLAK